LCVLDFWVHQPIAHTCISYFFFLFRFWYGYSENSKLYIFWHLTYISATHNVKEWWDFNYVCYAWIWIKYRFNYFARYIEWCLIIFNTIGNKLLNSDILDYFICWMCWICRISWMFHTDVKYLKPIQLKWTFWYMKVYLGIYS